MIVIIGGGISGLAVAWYLQKKGIEYVLLESSERAGGNILTEKTDKYLIEKGPNSLLADNEVQEIIDEIGLTDRILYPESVSKNRYIFKDGKYRKLPAGPAFLFSDFFSFNAKLSVFKEYSNKSKGDENETVASFFERRFSKEIVDNAVNPFVSGIYAGDPEQMLIRKTFPQLFDFEKEYGSIIKGFLKTKSSSGRRVSYSFHNGMQEIPDQLAKSVNIKYNSEVQSIEKGEKFIVKSNSGEYLADKVILSLPAFSAFEILSTLASSEISPLNNVHYPELAVVHTAFKKADMQAVPNGFGGLHPKKAGLYTAGCMWSSCLFPVRCPEDEFLLTSFVGGSQFEQEISYDNDTVRQNVTNELKRVYEIDGEPVFQKIHRWKKSIPQYTQKIDAAHEVLESLEKQDIYHTINWEGGVSIADCLKKGKALAEKIEKNMNK
ncbi:protoporphyrinogen oxidase [Chondrinema litorale]|uniref:protoporphyrinogen oxidase n=1 Tax=Chondrinema litorale TaxID=2994555 RepID=UPI002543E984|nr:protoporphyrinogen oxidase [Chondrinema litorale]UZR93124.1 protoporphyrinogen oxidase [Chondrinema litorale]